MSSDDGAGTIRSARERAGQTRSREASWARASSNGALRDLIAGGKAEPSFLVSHELSLDEASSAYEHFDNRDDGWTKVVLHPNGSNGSNRRASAGKRGGRATAGSSGHTVEELRQEAKAQGIEGRPHMNKQQLERALKH